MPETDQTAATTPPDEVEPQPGSHAVNFAERRALTSEQMKALVSLNQMFARSLSANLSGSLQAEVFVSLVTAERVLFRDQLATYDPDGMFLIEGMFKHFSAAGLLQMDLPCVNALVHLGLGGSYQLPTSEPLRELTEIDTEIVGLFLSTVWRELGAIWGESGLEIASERRVPPTDAVKVFSYSEYLLSFTYSLNISGVQGSLILSLPTAIADLLLRQIESKSSPRAQSPEVRVFMEQRLGQIAQRGELTLPAFRMSIAELTELKVGSIVLTGITSTARSHFSVAGGPVWEASVMQNNGKIMAHIAGRVERTLNNA